MASQPVHEIRLGAIKASIRRKRTQRGFKYTVSVVRLYRNGEEWKQSTRFTQDDLPRVRLALDLAHTWLLQHNPTAT